MQDGYHYLKPWIVLARKGAAHSLAYGLRLGQSFENRAGQGHPFHFCANATLREQALDGGIRTKKEELASKFLFFKTL